jgi:protease I
MKHVFLIISIMFLIVLLLWGCKGQKQEVQVSQEETTPQKAQTGKKVVMIIAPENFRDEELLEPQKILTEKGVSVKIASASLEMAKGMLGAEVKPDMVISDIKPEEWDAIILVGGSGASKYWDDASVHAILNDAVKLNKIVGAICIAPVTCANAGILAGKQATVFESEADKLKDKGAKYTGASVQKDGNIITANGPPAAKEFGNAIAQALME